MSENKEQASVLSTTETINQVKNHHDLKVIESDKDPDDFIEGSAPKKSGKLEFSKDKMTAAVRLNKKPLFIGVSVVGVSLLIMFVGLSSRGPAEVKQETESVETIAADSGNGAFNRRLEQDIEKHNRAKLLQEEREREAALEAERLRMQAEQQQEDIVQPGNAPRNSITSPNANDRTIAEQQMIDPALLEEQRQEALRKKEAHYAAMQGEMGLEIKQSDRREKQQGGMMNVANNQNAQNEQGSGNNRKDVLQRAVNEDVMNNTNISLKTRPITKNIVTAGSVIPSALVTAMNSDLPGPVFAMVTTDVRDSINGTKILIPKGSKLIGRYDSNVTYGVTRSFVLWQRVIFPDAKSYVLRGMSGSDPSGNVGLSANVDNHWDKVIGAAVLSSIFTGAVAYASPNEFSANTTNPNQVAQSQFARTVNEAATRVIQRELSVKPTLTVPVGYAFNVLVDKDLYLEDESLINNDPINTPNQVYPQSMGSQMMQPMNAMSQAGVPQMPGNIQGFNPAMINPGAISQVQQSLGIPIQ